MIRVLFAALGLFVSALAQQSDLALMDVVRNDEADPAARCEALAELQDREALSVRLLAYGLGQDGTLLQDTAAAIARHEWLEWPRDLFAALDADPVARRAMLRELAQGWRPGGQGPAPAGG